MMTQVEKGLDSACKCPECGHECKACLGGQKGANVPLGRNMSCEEWEAVLALREKDRE